MRRGFENIGRFLNAFFLILKQGIVSAPEGEAQPILTSLENGTNLETVISNEAQNDEKMETDKPEAGTVEESVNTQENIDNSIAQQTPVSADEQKHGEIKPEDEQNTAINEQELKYWNAVNENPQDFTSWTYLLQYVEQEVRKLFVNSAAWSH